MRLRMAGLVMCLIAGGTAMQSQKGKPDTNVGPPSYLRTQVAGRDLALDPPRIATDVWLRYMGRDKKNESGRITLILLDGLGRAAIVKDAPQEPLERFLAAA